MASKIIRCIVACTNSAGTPDFYCVRVCCTQTDYDNGDHYEAAKLASDRYEGPYVVFDENDSPCLGKINPFKDAGIDWDTVMLVDINGDKAE